MSSFAQRLIGTARLRAEAYEEVEHDEGATLQAVFVVVLANVAIALGTWGLSTGGNFLQPLLGALVSWALFAVSVYVVGAQMLREPQTNSSILEVLRTIGFASSPMLLNVFGLIPLFGFVTLPLTAVWSLAATVVAVRQALDFSGTGRAIAVTVISFFVFLLTRAMISGVTGGLL